MYKRYQVDILNDRLNEDRHFIQVIVGPRQVGKSTMVKQLLKEVKMPNMYASSDDVPTDSAQWISTQWAAARMRMEAGHHQEYLLVLDEVQKVSNWSETVKKEWDSDTFNDVNLKVVLLGSSRLLLKKGLTESLAGRFELLRMGHWSYAEMRDAFGWTIDQYIYYGGYPGSAHLVRNETRWSQYVRDAIVEPAISKDVLMTTTIYKPAVLRQLFELGCGYSGELLSFNKMLGQLTDAGNVTTLASYLNVLSECQLLMGLQKYANDDARKYNSIPKYQVFNSALLSVYQGRSFKAERITPDRWGRWVETAVGAYLVGKADEVGYRVYYWRDSPLEVDFVLSKGGVLVAIEVKSGHRTTNDGLPWFQEHFAPRRAFVVGSGGIPVEEFLQYDLSLLFG